MKQMATYDLMETMRNTNEWLGASARAMASVCTAAEAASSTIAEMFVTELAAALAEPAESVALVAELVSDIPAAAAAPVAVFADEVATPA